VLDHSPHRAPEPPSQGTSLSLGVQFCKPVDRRSHVAAGEGGALLVRMPLAWISDNERAQQGYHTPNIRE
jgi:hypothetical protein